MAHLHPGEGPRGRAPAVARDTGRDRAPVPGLPRRDLRGRGCRGGDRHGRRDHGGGPAGYGVLVRSGRDDRSPRSQVHLRVGQGLRPDDEPVQCVHVAGHASGGRTGRAGHRLLAPARHARAEAPGHRGPREPGGGDAERVRQGLLPPGPPRGVLPAGGGAMTVAQPEDPGTVDSPKAPPPVDDLDWDPERARRFTDAAASMFGEYLARLRDLPVALPEGEDEVRAAVAIPVPDEPMADEDVLAYLREMAFRWSMYPGHPRFLAYITGAGTVPGVAADLLASGLNQNLGGWRLSPAATEIELHLTRWFAQQFGLPSGAGGLFVSGGAVANFVALKVARDRMAGLAVRQQGVAASGPAALYASTEVHVVTDRAADMLGLGMLSVRTLPLGSGLRMRVAGLRGARARDRAAGVGPLAVVATAGTVATGA